MHDIFTITNSITNKEGTAFQYLPSASPPSGLTKSLCKWSPGDRPPTGPSWTPSWTSCWKSKSTSGYSQTLIVMTPCMGPWMWTPTGCHQGLQPDLCGTRPHCPTPRWGAAVMVPVSNAYHTCLCICVTQKNTKLNYYWKKFNYYWEKCTF